MLDVIEFLLAAWASSIQNCIDNLLTLAIYIFKSCDA